MLSHLALSLGISLASPGLQDARAQLDALFEHCAENEMLNGVVLVRHDGETVYERAFGTADPRSGDPLTVDSAFYLASVSKQFTSMMAMILSESGELSLDDSIADYFPELESFASDVRIHHLMSNTSGLPDHYRLLGQMPETLHNADVLKLLVEHGKLDFEPGAQFRYSNGGYVMLSMVIAKAAGTSYREVFHERIIEPLGLTGTFVYDETDPEVKNRVVGFRPDGELDDYSLYTTGAGGMFTTVRDLARWDQALHDNELISAELQERAFTPPTLPSGESRYAFGWVVTSYDPLIVSHSGGLNAFSTFIVRDIPRRNTFILLSNKGGSLVNPEFLAESIANFLRGGELELPPIRIHNVMRSWIAKDGLDAALARYDEIWKAKDEAYDLGEGLLNALGYEYMGRGDVDTALAIFVRNTESYPDAFNTWDSLGEAYLTLGDKDAALASYKRSLELNPEHQGAVEAIARIKGR